MQTKFFKSFVSLLVFISFPIQFAQAFDGSNFVYFKELSGEADQGIVAIELDKNIYQNSNYSDLKIVDNEGTEQPYDLINHDLSILSPSTKILDSSAGIDEFEGKNFLPANMLDGDKETFYEAVLGNWDPSWEAYSSFIILDLGEEKKLKVVDFTLNKFAKYWTRIEVQTSLDNEEYSIASRINKIGESADKQLNFEDLKTRYLKLTFWYQEVLSIAELSVYGADNSKLIFDYDPAKSYKLYYGNSNLTETTKNLNLDFSSETPVLVLGEEQLNPNYNADLDKDGILNLEDNCPLKANADQQDSDKDGFGDICDETQFMNNQNSLDIDFDGIGQSSDNCTFVKNAAQYDKNNNGIGDECDDNDGDTIINILDNCIDVKNYDQLDINHDGVGDLCEGDYDQDNVEQAIDNCKNIANPDQQDSDADGIGDLCDNCSQMKNYDQLDANQNGIGDLCEDADSDGIIDAEDNCKNIANPDQLDSDEDSKGDVCDNCLEIKNASQWDDDGDGIGNECDDDDADGVLGKDDNCPNHANPDQLDSDQNGVGDFCEDSDGDSIIDLADNCVKHFNTDQIDEDQDGIGDACDPKVFVKKTPYLFYGLLGGIGLAILYYAFKLIKQVSEMKDEEK